MKNLICTCECGHRFHVSDSAWGMESVCGMCGRPIQVTPDNTRPVDVEIPPGESDRGSSADHCARCGRPFRGDWDKNSSAEGMICHICANQGGRAQSEQPALNAEDGSPHAAVSEPTARPAPPADSALEAAGAVLIDHDPDAMDDEEPSLGKRFENFRETPAFRRGLWAAAVSVMVLAVVAAFMKTPPPPDDAALEAVSESSGGLRIFGPPEAWSSSEKAAVRVTTVVLETVFLFVPTVAALFLALAFVGRLPAHRWFASAIHVGVVSMGITVALYLVPRAIGIFGGFPGVLLAYLLAAFFIRIIYGRGLRAAVLFVGLRAGFGLLAGLARVLLYGALGTFLLS